MFPHVQLLGLARPGSAGESQRGAQAGAKSGGGGGAFVDMLISVLIRPLAIRQGESYARQLAAAFRLYNTFVNVGVTVNLQLQFHFQFHLHV